MRDPYEVLGVRKGATKEEIKKLILSLSKSIILINLKTIHCVNLQKRN